MQNCDLPKRVTRNIMREVDEMLYKQHLEGVFDDGDPNHPKWNSGINYATGLPANLFGYDIKEFLRKQYN